MMEFIERLKAFEHRIQANMSEIFCPVQLCLGAEQVSADLADNIRTDDWLFSYHRAHGHYMAKGGDMEKLYDEIMGLPSGINGGFSGSQEFTDPSINFHCSAIVGGLVGVATGVAYALKMNGSNSIVVCCVGDAGTEQGVFWESMNFAALHELPIAYVCENNGMSVDSPISERQARGIAVRVAAFGVHAVPSLRRAIDLARDGLPSFYEAKITRECAHINMATMTEL